VIRKIGFTAVDRRPCDRSSGSYAWQVPDRAMQLSRPTHIRLTADLIARLDAWRGDRMNRATAIRVLLEQALKERKA
jgi:hypothetical protein